jgi:hypothetical protein
MNGTTDYVELYGRSNGTSLSGDTTATYFTGALIAPNAAVNSVWSISDERFKENIATTTSGLDLLARIPILDFNLIGDPEHRQQGFIAQELYKYYPDAVVVGGDNQFLNPWLVDYGRITPLLAKAIQDLNLKLEDLATTSATTTDQSSFTNRFFASLFARLTHWFADAANGIAKLFVGEVHTDKLCVGETCVTPEQFAEVFGSRQSAAAAGAPGLVSGVEAPDGSSTEAAPTADTATTTTPASEEEETDAPEGPSEAPAASAEEETTTDAAAPITEAGGETRAEITPAEQPTNDNQPSEELPATGTE